MIIAVTSEKGGTGKSTISTNLAGMRASAGRDVLIADVDRQGSSYYWAEIRASKDVPGVTASPVSDRTLEREIKNLAYTYDDIVIDVPPRDSSGMEAALRVADKAIIPVGPSGYDIWTTGTMDDKVGKAKLSNPGLVALVVITGASANPRDGDAVEARAAMGELSNMIVSDVVLRTRVAFRRVAPTGLTVCEYRPVDHKAVKEMKALYKAVFEE